MNPLLLAGLLRSPLEFRRALWSEGALGSWYSDRGSGLFIFASFGANDADFYCHEGWAFWPASEVAWMQAACPKSASPEWCPFSDVAKPWHYLGNDGEILFESETAPECALRAVGALE